MQLVIQRSLGFLLLIVLGTRIRKRQDHHAEIFDILTWLMTHITLPCVILQTMNGKHFSASLLLLIPVGMAANGLLLLSCLAVTKNRRVQAIKMISISGFNIGCFALPLVNGLFSAEAMLGLCMFDLGNAIMCLGLNADVAAMRCQGVFSGKRLLNHTLHSVPVWAYLMMLIMCMLQIELTSWLIPMIDTAASANPFLAMLSIGLALDFHLKKETAASVLSGVIQRAVLSLLMALLLLFSSLPVEMKQLQALLCLSPISAVSCTFARKLQLDYEQAASINSLYMLLSMALICGFVIIVLG